MGGLVARRLLEFENEGVPPEILQELRERQRAQVLFSLRMTAELFRLFESFAAAGLETLAIKGPVLSMRCYGDPGARQYGDLDLIVRDKDILRTTDLMTGLGYEPRVSPAAIQAKKAPGEYAFRQAGHETARGIPHGNDVSVSPSAAACGETFPRGRFAQKSTRTKFPRSRPKMSSS